MCSHCKKILGRKETHTSEECPLIESAHCSFCGIWGVHFTVDCPHKPQLLPHDAKHIPNTRVAIPKPCMILPDNPVVYIKFLGQYGIDPLDTNAENREKVKDILQKRGTPLTLIHQKK